VVVTAGVDAAADLDAAGPDVIQVVEVVEATVRSSEMGMERALASAQ
jgi:hypothetical protein